MVLTTVAGDSLKSSMTVKTDLVILAVTSVSDSITDPLAHNWKDTINKNQEKFLNYSQILEHNNGHWWNWNIFSIHHTSQLST